MARRSAGALEGGRAPALSVALAPSGQPSRADQHGVHSESGLWRGLPVLAVRAVGRLRPLAPRMLGRRGSRSGCGTAGAPLALVSQRNVLGRPMMFIQQPRALQSTAGSMVRD